MYNRRQYVELAKARITESRNIIISDCGEGYTAAQQLVAPEGTGFTTVFLKGAFHLDDLESIYNFRDALNAAISKIESEQQEGWD
ncbi:MAG: hypothetical protein ACRCZQ_08150 [Bacteroidales bacterium]